MMRKHLYQVWMTEDERRTLAELAQRTGRTRAGVVRRLIHLAAADLATGPQRLGEELTAPQAAQPDRAEAHR